MQKHTYCMRKKFWPITRAKPVIMLFQSMEQPRARLRRLTLNVRTLMAKRKCQTCAHNSIHTNKSQTLHYSAWHQLSRREENKRTYLKRRGKYLGPSAHGRWDMYCDVLTIAPVANLFFPLTWEMSASGILQWVLFLTYPHPVRIETFGKGFGLSIPVTSSQTMKNYLCTSKVMVY